MKNGYVYIITNNYNTVIYTGVTADLIKRIYEHKRKAVEGFSKRYNLKKLVYYETFDSIENAILREKQIKGWIRKKKIALVETKNPKWEDLYEHII